MATSAALDREGHLLGGITQEGDPIGIPLDFALQEILGLTKNSPTDDAIVAGDDFRADTDRKITAGPDAVLDSTVGGDDVLGVDEILPGSNGVIDTLPAGDDELFGPRQPCTVATEGTDCPGGACDGGEAIFRIRNRRSGDFNRVWAVITGDELRQVFPDPRVPDGDGDGINDIEEQNLRRLFAGTCANSDNVGDACLEDADCPFAGGCVNSDNVGDGCAVDEDCTIARLCVGSDNAGDTCSADADCPIAATSGTCQLVSAGNCVTVVPAPFNIRLCASGANIGSSCSSDADCGTLDACVGVTTPASPALTTRTVRHSHPRAPVPPRRSVSASQPVWASAG